MQELRVKTNHIELQVRSYPGDGNPLIFLHFSNANLMMWQRIIPFFQEKYRVILVDTRGHGRSDRPDASHHIDEMAKDIAGMMDRMGVKKAHIVGSSLGAEVGLSVAANYPEKIISLVCDGALSSEFGPYGTWEGSELEFKKDVAETLQKMRDKPVTYYPSVEELVEARREILTKYGLWNEHVEAMERYGAYKAGDGNFTHGMGKNANQSYMQGYFHCRLEDYYNKISCPILMIAEKENENEVEKAAMRGLRDLAKQAQIAEIRGWMHPYGWLLDPDEICRVILDFLGNNPDSKLNS